MQTILVVDDEFGAVEVLATVLEEEGFRVLSAANGLGGLRSLTENAVNLVIMDFMMPLLDGPAMAAAMRAQHSLAGIPIIMMSAASEAAVRQRFDGYVTFLRKPFDISELVDVVRSVLSSPVSEPGASGNAD